MTTPWPPRPWMRTWNMPQRSPTVGTGTSERARFRCPYLPAPRVPSEASGPLRRRGSVVRRRRMQEGTDGPRARHGDDGATASTWRRRLWRPSWRGRRRAGSIRSFGAASGKTCRPGWKGGAAAHAGPKSRPDSRAAPASPCSSRVRTARADCRAARGAGRGRPRCAPSRGRRRARDGGCRARARVGGAGGSATPTRISARSVSVAVRSSATAEDAEAASITSMSETYLNVRGADAVVDAVRRC